MLLFILKLAAIGVLRLFVVIVYDLVHTIVQFVGIDSNIGLLKKLLHRIKSVELAAETADCLLRLQGVHWICLGTHSVTRLVINYLGICDFWVLHLVLLALQCCHDCALIARILLALLLIQLIRRDQLRNYRTIYTQSAATWVCHLEIIITGPDYCLSSRHLLV